MTERRRVSVITGTYPPRVEEMVSLMRHLREQTYPNIEHCIVVEGDPDDVDATVLRLKLEATALSRSIPTRIVGLGRWWSRYLASSHACVPFMVANYLSAGEYQMWWSDDERALVSDHVEALVDFLEAGGYDFVSPLLEVYRADRPDECWIVGQDPPENGTVSHVLHKTSLLDIGGFRPHVGGGSDWDQAERWLDAGARFGLLQRVTFSHRSDYMHRDTMTARQHA